MKSRAKDNRMLWWVCGVLVGICLAYVWPHEELFATATDRSDNFAICTVTCGPGFPDAVFALDFLTGQLSGAMVSPQSQIFTNFWFTNVSEDFEVKKGAKVKFTMMPGQGFLNANAQQQGAGTVAIGVIYIGEVTTGKVGCYKFYYRNQIAPERPMPLEKVDAFKFREQMK